MSHSRFHSKTLLGLAAFGLALLGLAEPAAAEPRPSSDVLVPYFEVALDPTQGLSTLFSVCNGSDDPVDVMISVHTNWGIRPPNASRGRPW